MTATPDYQEQAHDRKRIESRIHFLHYELVKTIQAESGKECFASDLTKVCPEIYCQWRDDCFRFRVD